MRENVNLIMILRKSSLKQVKNDLVGKKNVIRMRKQQLYYRLCIFFIPCYIIRKIIITVLHTNMISWKYGNMAINWIVVLCANTMYILRDNYIFSKVFYVTFQMLPFQINIKYWWLSVELKDNRFSGYW